MTPLVSIVIVAHNNWPGLETTLQSALCQSYRPLEVLVIDNSSTDATPREVERLFSGRVRYLRQANVGDAGAYNAGLREARGEFLQFLDGDDVLAPCKVARQMEVFLDAPDTDVVYGDTRLFRGPEGAGVLKDTATGPEPDLLAAFLASRGDYFGNTLGLLLRRGALEKVGPWDTTVYVTDADYWLRALWAGCRFRPCPGALMGFVCVSPGKMSSDAARMLRGQEALWLKALGAIDREPYRSLVRANLAAIRVHLALRASDLGLREALDMLALARAGAPEALPAAAYGAAVAALLLPGGRALARSPRWRCAKRRPA